MSDGVTLRAMRANDLATADRVFKLAFGTWFGLADPMQFRGDASIMAARLGAYPEAGIVAERDGAMIGFSFASDWGSLGVLGPVAVLPDYWRHGLARRLVAATCESFDRRRHRLAGLFTFPFPQDATHLRLYQDLGFWPRSLVPVMAKPATASAMPPDAILLSRAPDRGALVAQCRALTDGVFAGLDLGAEIAAAIDGGFGEVIVLAEGSAASGFAVCHAGAGSEGGSKSCFVKFALARSGAEAESRLRRLIAACEAYALSRGIATVSAGTAAARHGAYRLLVELGFRATLTGVAMHRPYIDAYDRPEVFVLDDWR